MKIAKNFINTGYLQGVISQPPFFPDGKTAMFVVKVKDKAEPKNNKKNTKIVSATAQGNGDVTIRTVSEEPAEKTSAPENTESPETTAPAPTAPVKKQKATFVKCTAFGEAAAALKNAKLGTLVFIQYHLTRTKKLDDEGVVTMYDNRIADTVVVGETLDGAKQIIIPYINKGICQGSLVDVYVSPTNPEEAHIPIQVPFIGKGNKEYSQFIDFKASGDIVKNISRYYNSGDSICLSYKIVTEANGRKSVTTYHITDVH